MSLSSIQKLNQRHYKIIDLCIAGLTNVEISKQLKMHQRSVSVIIKAPSFQHELAIRRDGFQKDLDEKLASKEAEASQILKDNSAKAAECLVSGMVLGTTESNRRSAAESILDRTGHGRASVSNDDTGRTIINLKREDLELLNETLKLEKQIDEISKPKENVAESST